MTIAAIKDHIEKGNYDIAIQLIAELPENVFLEGQIIKSRIFERQGNFKDALALAEEAVIKTQEINDICLELEALNAQVYALWRLGEYNTGLSIINRGEDLLTRLSNEEQENTQASIATFYHVTGNINTDKGDPDLALKYFEKSLTIRESIGNKQMIAFSYNNIGNVYSEKGEFDRALEYYQKSLAIDEELGNKQDIAYAINNIGFVYQLKGEPDVALEYFQKSLAIFELINTKHDIANSYSLFGHVYLRKGNLEEALMYYKKAADINENIGNKSGISDSYANFGRIYRAKGELELALEYFQKSLSISSSIGSKGGEAGINNLIGSIYFEKGKYDQAQLYFNKSLNYARSINNALYISGNLFNLIYVSLSQQDEQYAKQLFTEFEKINSSTENKWIDIQFRLINALILKQSKRIIQKTKAQEILTEIANEDNLHYNFTVLAMQNLTELLLDELKTYGEPEVLEEAKNLIKNLYEIGQSQHSFTIIVDALILQSKFALLEGKLNTATTILEQAILTAEEKGLDKLLEKAKQEKNILNSQFSEWKNLVERNASMHERVNQAQIYEYLKKAQQIIATSDFTGQM
ncbi:MAG: tetratricopeptide repeat protein [Candidatus Hodarchaeales archaeon]|jgi:tetratricopeptide (TPR) repeat protein